MKTFSFLARRTLVLFAATFFLMIWAAPAFALQTHASPEGLYIHQGSHLLLAFSLLILALNIRRSRLIRQRAWQFFANGALLLVFWSLWAVVGHLFTRLIPQSSFIMEEGHRAPSLVINSWQAMVYYFLKMDHLFCLPALLLFYIGLKLLLKEYTAAQAEERMQP